MKTCPTARSRACVYPLLYVFLTIQEPTLCSEQVCSGATWISHLRSVFFSLFYFHHFSCGKSTNTTLWMLLRRSFLSVPCSHLCNPWHWVTQVLEINQEIGDVSSYPAGFLPNLWSLAIGKECKHSWLKMHWMMSCTNLLTHTEAKRRCLPSFSQHRLFFHRHSWRPVTPNLSLLGAKELVLTSDKE